MNGIQDHFNGSGPDYSLWAYYNMNSPCYNPPERYGDSMLKLVEYDGFNEGNCLLSRRYTGLHASVSAVLAGVEKEGVGGACVGFYAGNGAYTDYVLLCADSKSLQIRVPSGAQKGASFMDAGQPQQSGMRLFDSLSHGADPPQGRRPLYGLSGWQRMPARRDEAHSGRRARNDQGPLRR